MSKTNRQLNRRKNALELLKRQMGKDGWEFKKQIKNSITFRHVKTGKKIKKTLVVE